MRVGGDPVIHAEELAADDMRSLIANAGKRDELLIPKTRKALGSSDDVFGLISKERNGRNLFLENCGFCARKIRRIFILFKEHARYTIYHFIRTLRGENHRYHELKWGVVEELGFRYRVHLFEIRDYLS